MSRLARGDGKDDRLGCSSCFLECWPKHVSTLRTDTGKHAYFFRVFNVKSWVNQVTIVIRSLCEFLPWLQLTTKYGEIVAKCYLAWEFRMLQRTGKSMKSRRYPNTAAPLFLQHPERRRGKLCFLASTAAQSGAGIEKHTSWRNPLPRKQVNWSWSPSCAQE